MDKVIITAAVVGAEVMKEHNPHVPYTPDEIADEVARAHQAGASVAHIHARRSDGTPTQDRKIYQQIIEKIKERCDIIIQVSTGGAVGMSPAERIQPLELHPEMGTLTTGSVNFGEDIFANSFNDLKIFAQKFQEYRVKPECEIFEVGMISNALKLVKLGLLHPPLHFDFVMGVPGGIPATPKNLLHLVEQIPEGSTWTVAGIGRWQLPMAAHALLWGGHVRVGFEDNLFYEKGILATSNAQLVERVVRLAREIGRDIASPDEARKILHIQQS
uniref:3-keto-5-aminohexanoate cleavage enzyme n=1 Tax=Microaerobacter geothermalis TaxID=674972 RepID=UPI0038B3C46F